MRHISCIVKRMERIKLKSLFCLCVLSLSCLTLISCKVGLEAKEEISSKIDDLLPDTTTPVVTEPGAPVVLDPLESLGQQHYASSCSGCHGSLELSTINKNTSIEKINGAIASIPEMGFLANIPLNKAALVSAIVNSEKKSVASGPEFSCTASDRRGLATDSTRRLTQFELKQVIKDIFGADVLAASSDKLGLYQKEVFVETVNEFNRGIDSGLAYALYDIAEGVAIASLATYADSQRVMPSCMLSAQNTISLENSSCNNQFLNTMGLKILRRPLTPNQLSIFNVILNSNENFHRYNRDRIQAVLTAMMLTPEFTHMYSVITAKAGEKGRVDNYTLASRMSFELTGSLPDAQLFNKAANNQLGTAALRKAEAKRLLSLPSSRVHVRNMFRHILELDRDFTLDNDYGAFVNISSNNLLSDFKTEALNFVEHIIFEEGGNLDSLLNSTKAFPPTANAAKVFNLSTASNGVRDPKNATSGHAGVFMRPIFLVSAGMRTAPIIRGLKYTAKVLCNHIPEPDPALVEAGEEEAETLDTLNLSSRDIADHLTSSVNCQSCHQHINPPGFFLESFGPFGDKRTQEAVFNASKSFVRNLPIDSVVEGLKIDNVERRIASSADFNEAISNSTQGQSCFVQNVFRYSKLRELSSDDDCHMSDLETVTREKKPVLDILIQNAISEDQLWEKIN